MRSSKTLLPFSLLAAIACGGEDKVDEIMCPTGTVRAGNNCVAAMPDAGAETDSGVPDPDGGIPEDGGVPEDGGAPEDSGTPEDGGVEGSATLSATTLDFGRSVVGEAHTRDIFVENTTNAPVNVNLGIISGPQGGDFTVTASDPITPSGILLQPGNRVTFSFTFTPRDNGARIGALAFELCEGACPATVNLSGEGLEDAITCSPASIDFLLVNPNSCVTEIVDCANASSYDGTIAAAAMRAGSSAAFSIAPASMFPIVVGAGMSELIDVLYCPTGLTNDTGTLDITTVHPDALRAVKNIALVGAGGGPDVTCVQASVSFGVLATGQTATRTVNCQNNGNAPAMINAINFAAGSAIELSITSPTPMSIAPLGTFEVVLQYAPQTAGTHMGVLEIASDDRDTPVLSISVSGEAIVSNGCTLTVAPNAIDFGAVLVNSTALASVELANIGTGPCTVNLVGLSAGSSNAFTLVTPPQSRTVDAGTSFTVDIEFAPLAQQTYTGGINMMTTDLLLPSPLEIALSGGGIDANYPIVAAPSPVDFGTVAFACADPVVRMIRVSNISAAAVSVVAAIESGSSAAFTLGALTTFTIQPASTADVEVRFLPSTAGTHSGRVGLTPGALPPIFVNLDGVGDAIGHNVQTFAPRPVQVVDFLLVVDDSCSMFEEQTSLANTAATLIARADASGADYHIAVTTTDPGDTPPWLGGQLRGTPTVITSALATRVQDLQASINQGTSGSGFEQGLFTAAQAVTNPTLLTGPNAGFLRSNADLVILLVSDEPDQSPDTTPFYINQLRSRASGPFDSVRFYSITGGLTGCTGPNGVADPGLDYVEAATALGGFDRSICDANYTQFITEIADEAFDPTRSSYQLGSPPAPGSIDVYVDNVLTPPTVGMNAVWGVDYGDGRVVFAPGQSPSGSSTVRIEYDAFCVPSTCGNGSPQGSEQCDDGNVTNTDACPNTCYVAICGDGFIRTNVEQCDDFNNILGDGCNSSCITEGCGNGFIEPPEQCDNGAMNSNTVPNACRTTCLPAGCGDTVIDTGETCDDANTDNTDACVTCQTAVCGDGFVRTGVEQCDDGNNINNDLCTNACTYNLGSFTITTVPNSPLTPTAGGTAIVWPFGGDEDVVPQAIGFSFTYLNATVADVSVAANGVIAFEPTTSVSFNNVAIPNTAAPNAFVAWWWDDFDFGRAFPGVTTSATTSLLGTAPNRIRVFTFQNVGRYGFGAEGTVVTAEVRLFETTNVIEVHYGTVVETTATPSIYGATVGYETTGGLAGTHAIACGSTCTTANWPTSTIYRYTP